jgi:hypothetical protein
MKWILLGIVLFIVPYTYLTLHYRKSTPAYLPYEDTRDRVRAGHAGYERVVGGLVRLADPPRGDGVTGEPAAGGLPEPLRAALIDPVLLPALIGSVAAAPSADHATEYRMEFSCTLSDNRQQPESAQIYLKDNEVLIVPACERLAGGLVARTREAVLVVTVPPRSLEPGRYHMTLVGERASKAWTLQVH